MRGGAGEAACWEGFCRQRKTLPPRSSFRRTDSLRSPRRPAVLRSSAICKRPRHARRGLICKSAMLRKERGEMSQVPDAQVRQIISDVLNVPVETLIDQASPQTIENWDSVQHLNVVLALEEALGLQFEPEDIESMKDVG